MSLTIRSFKVFLFILIVAYTSQSQATVVKTMDFDSLSKSADAIVYGTVVQIDVNPHSGERTAIVEADDVIYAKTEFRNYRDFPIYLYNRAQPRSDIVAMVPLAPDVSEGEELLLFLYAVPEQRSTYSLRHAGKRVFLISGMYQGKYSIYRDKSGVRRVAHPTQANSVRLTAKQLQTQKTTSKKSSLAARRIFLKQQAENLKQIKIAELPTLNHMINQVHSVRGGQ